MDNGEEPLERLEINNCSIEKICEMAEDVLIKLETISYYYKEDGSSIYAELNNDKSINKEEFSKIAFKRIRAELHREEALGIDFLIKRILDEEYTLEDALNTTAAELKEKIAPLRKKIVGLFKDYSERVTPYYVGEDADEDLLLELVAMRLRERMIVAAAQRIKEGL